METLIMTVPVTKNMTNNNMYSVHELHTFS